MNIQEIFKLKNLTPIIEPIKECADPSLLYGLELEIEKCTSKNIETRISGFEIKVDGSLRNNGYEFVTLPMNFGALETKLPVFFEKHGFKASNYSDRCSVHVHANCMDLTLEQVKTICLLYQVFEDLFFEFCGQERHNNIFCVPWNQTNNTHALLNDFQTKLGRWQKYTALNILPLKTFGTIEFRHMGGEYEVSKILTWLNLIGSLFAYARKNTFEKALKDFCELNTTSHYTSKLQEVFGPWSDYLMAPNYEYIVSQGILNMKYSLLTDTRKNYTQQINEILGQLQPEQPRRA